MAAKKKKVECPECGRPFSGPAGLGAHRRAKHGVEGSSPRAKQYRKDRKIKVSIKPIKIPLDRRVSAKPTITKEKPHYSLPNDLKLDDIEMALAVFDNSTIANNDLWFRAARLEISVKDSETLLKLAGLFIAETFNTFNVNLRSGGRHFIATPDNGSSLEIDVQVDN